ncbi:lytic transglycosylase domain-containing protein [Phenylobacterium sp. VNQ135]|uniref:lytic transglycosylase domain-containing protein n=1 Tax=Phenylobacterium sp. VNQ135 TaxID=3400922 RepID=UPI003C0D5C5C
MSLSIAATLALAAQCAPDIAPETLLSVVHVESRFNPLAIGVNGGSAIRISPSTRAEAIAQASSLIAAGRNVDLGLAQINSRNLAWLGLTVEEAFDPCANLAAAARVLQDGYRRAAPAQSGPQAALRTAFSYYNTGRATRGFTNGYVGKVMRAAGHVVPAIRAAADEGFGQVAADAVTPSAPTPPAWDVFASRQVSGFVIRPTSSTTGALQ